MAAIERTPPIPLWRLDGQYPDGPSFGSCRSAWSVWAKVVVISPSPTLDDMAFTQRNDPNRTSQVQVINPPHPVQDPCGASSSLPTAPSKSRDRRSPERMQETRH
ncbi:uncharacterized protein BCR38DRAFT_406974 [Pseudomassariella vexata]|uniref:Uncharacterized protein n=1 Tax=Pseudomassariella vexata TaxID=1141098 RepID=A0A1Y2EC18_9PEZI|nr:uncharacterized protein BCR38DRAFT_406974 [Pseudomassariella vexata]ORY69108.1 hypothetical protein BCR38DRAFT_406974 [Pseudomassariella vexata]